MIKTALILSHRLVRFFTVMIALTVIQLASLGPASAQDSALNTMKPLDRTTPNTVVEQIDGTTLPFADLIDRPLLVNFWASWCPPCVHELPDLAVLDDALAAEGMGVMLVGLDRKGRDFAEDFLAKKGITIPARIYEPSGQLPRELKIKVMPTSFLITAEGQMIGRIEGPLDWSSPQVIDAVKTALQP